MTAALVFLKYVFPALALGHLCDAFGRRAFPGRPLGSAAASMLMVEAIALSMWWP